MASSSDDGSSSVVNYGTDHLNMIGNGIKETYYGNIQQLNVIGNNNEASIYGDCAVSEIKGDGNKVGIDGDTRKLTVRGYRNEIFINSDCLECVIIYNNNEISIRGESGKITISGKDNTVNGKRMTQTETLGVARNPATPQVEPLSGGHNLRVTDEYNFFGIDSEIKISYNGDGKQLNVIGNSNEASIYGDCEINGDGNKVGIAGDIRKLNIRGYRNKVSINRDCSECVIVGNNNEISNRGESGKITISGKDNTVNGKRMTQTETLGVASNPATPQVESVSGGHNLRVTDEYNFYGVDSKIKISYNGDGKELNVIGNSNEASIYGDCEINGDGNKVGIAGDIRKLNIRGYRNEVFINSDCLECVIIYSNNEISIRGESGKITISGKNNIVNGKHTTQTETLGVARNSATPQVESVSGGHKPRVADEYNFFGIDSEIKISYNGDGKELSVIGDTNEVFIKGDWSEFIRGYGNKVRISGDSQQLTIIGNNNDISILGDRGKISASGNNNTVNGKVVRQTGTLGVATNPAIPQMEPVSGGYNSTE